MITGRALFENIKGPIKNGKMVVAMALLFLQESKEMTSGKTDDNLVNHAPQRSLGEDKKNEGKEAFMISTFKGCVAFLLFGCLGLIPKNECLLYFSIGHRGGGEDDSRAA